jgi:hypothetical protein
MNHLDSQRAATYHGSSALVDKEYLTNDVRRDSVCWSASNTHEQSSGKETIESLCFSSPHTRKGKEQETGQYHWSTPKGICQWHPPKIRCAEHDEVDGD